MAIDPVKGTINVDFTPGKMRAKNSVKADNSGKIDTTDGFQKTAGQSMNLIDPGKLAGADISKAANALFVKSRSGVKQVWEVDLGKSDPKSAGHYQPTIHDNSIYINSEGATSRFDLDGNLLWKVDTEASGMKPPSFDSKGNVYITGENHLVALDKDGKERWSKKIGKRGCSHGPMMGNDGKIYLVDDDDVVLCFNTQGKEEWSKTVKGARSQEPYMDKNGILYVESSKGDGFNGSLVKLNTKKRGRVEGTLNRPTLHDVIPDEDGNCYGFNNCKFRATGPDGKEKWSMELPGDKTSTYPKIGPDGNIYLTVRNHTIICLEPNGKEKWRFEKDEKTEPLSQKQAWGDDGTLYVTGDGGNWKLYAIGPDGKEKWVTNEDKHVSSPKVGPDGTIYTGGEMYPLKAFDPKSGKKMWTSDESLSFGDNYQFVDKKDIILTTEDGKLK